MPIEAFKENDGVGACFVDFVIGHNREAEGYDSVWYDVFDADDWNDNSYMEGIWFFFTP